MISKDQLSLVEAKLKIEQRLSRELSEVNVNVTIETKTLCDTCAGPGGFQCSRCKKGSFCNKNCMKKGWKLHRKTCNTSIKYGSKLENKGHDSRKEDNESINAGDDKITKHDTVERKLVHKCDNIMKDDTIGRKPA